MRKIRVIGACLLVLGLATGAWGAPSKKELQAMGLFLSNFTELGFTEIVTEEMARPENYPDLVRFGIMHNYVNNFKSRIEKNKEGAQGYGDFRIKASWVEESLRRYFGLEVAANKSVDASDPPYHFDGKYFHFWASDGEAPWYARVEKATSPQKGLWELSGVVYNADDPEELLGDFSAVIREGLWKGKLHYVLVRLKTEVR